MHNNAKRQHSCQGNEIIIKIKHYLWKLTFQMLYLKIRLFRLIVNTEIQLMSEKTAVIINQSPGGILVHFPQIHCEAPRHF